MDFKNIYVRLEKFKSEIFWIILGQGTTFIGGFLGIKLLTNLMSIESYGQLAFALTIAGVMNMFLYGPMANAIMRYFSIFKEKQSLHIFIKVIKKIHVRYFNFVLCAGTILILSVAFFKDLSWAAIALLAIVIGLVNGLNVTLISILIAARKRKTVVINQGLDNLLKATLAGFAVYFISDSMYMAALGFVLGTSAAVFSQIRYLKRNKDIFTIQEIDSKDDEQELFKKFFDYTKAFVPIALFGVFGVYADKWLLQTISGEKMLGVYAAIYQIASAPISIFGGMISQFMVPIIFEQAGTMSNRSQVQKSSEMHRYMIIFYSVGIVSVVFVTYFFAEPLIKLLTTKEIAFHHDVLWIIALSLFMTGLAEQLALVGFKNNKPQVYLMPKVIQSVVFLLVGYFLISRFGIRGAGMASCCASSAYLFSVVIVNKKIKKNNLDQLPI